MFREILAALAFAHDKHVFHRDLKPQNIIVRSSDEQPIILDFGCAYFLDDLDEDLTTTFIGTSAYVPPEVHLNPKLRTPKQDVYACGVLLYEVLVGRLPDREDYEEVDSIRDGFKGIDEIILDALAPAKRRIESPAAMYDRLMTLARKTIKFM